MAEQRARSVYRYQPPDPPPLRDLLAGGEGRRRFLRYWVTDNLNNLTDLAVHFGLKLLPMDACSALGARLGVFAMPRFHKAAVARARANLKQLLPEASEAEREALLYRNWQNLGRLMTEFSIIRRVALSPGRVKGIDPKWVLETAASGPLVLVGLHLGNWEMMVPPLSALGLKLNANYVPPNARARAWIAEKVRLESGLVLMPPGRDGIRPALKALKEGGIVSMFCDEGFQGWIRGPFLGRPPHLDGNLTLAVKLARRAGARIVPWYMLREEGLNFTFHHLPVIDLPPEESPGARLMEDVILLNSVIEPVTRAHLDQWYFLDSGL